MWALKTAKKMPKCVQVEWEDGLLARFNYLWLHDNSPRRPSLVHLDLNARPETVECCKDSLNLTWPPFLNTNYSSDFLRKTALNTPIDQQNAGPSSSQSSFSSIFSASELISKKYKESQPLQGHKWLITDSIPVDPTHVLGESYWEGTAQEPGTVSPHFQTLPTLCAVDILSKGPANLMVVDGARAVATLATQHPEAFEFLAQCVLEYSAGIFQSRHPIFSINNGTVEPNIVFNNAARSSSKVTVEPLDKLYESFQKFGRICAEMTQMIRLEPGQRLLLDNTKVMLGAPAQSNRFLLIRCLA